MTLYNGGIAQASASFKKTGKYVLQVKCDDVDGDELSGKSITISVGNASANVNPGKIIKVGCGATQNESCNSVYYYAADGKRHAFQNESVFKSWYKDFEDVVILSQSAMSQIAIGENVVYKPGNSLVKFDTSTVYAVSYGGQLREIANEEIARVIWGDNWNSLVHDVSVSFFGDYRFGDAIESSDDFSPRSVQSASKTIEATL
jgi:hypothetical protein